MADLSHVKYWIFDLDNTLYRGDAGFFAQIDKKITEYVSRYLALQPVRAREVQKEYLVDYGTTLSGLMAVHGMDPTEYLDFVHDVNLDTLKPNPMLRLAIDALPGQKFIFTNGSRGHAENVATHLGLWDLFDGSFGVDDVDYIPKPLRSPYVKFCDHFGINPQEAVMFEDNLRNLEAPKSMGMETVLIVADRASDHDMTVTALDGVTKSADWVDHMTDDLAGWLQSYLATQNKSV